jgi:hypothetical protein
MKQQLEKKAPDLPGLFLFFGETYRYFYNEYLFYLERHRVAQRQNGYLAEIGHFYLVLV